MRKRWRGTKRARGKEESKRDRIAKEKNMKVQVVHRDCCAHASGALGSALGRARPRLPSHRKLVIVSGIKATLWNLFTVLFQSRCTRGPKAERQEIYRVKAQRQEIYRVKDTQSKATGDLKGEGYLPTKSMKQGLTVTLKRTWISMAMFIAQKRYTSDHDFHPSSIISTPFTLIGGTRSGQERPLHTGHHRTRPEARKSHCDSSRVWVEPRRSLRHARSQHAHGRPQRPKFTRDTFD